MGFIYIYDLTLFIHVVKHETYENKIKKSFNIFLVSIYPDFSKITQSEMYLSDQRSIIKMKNIPVIY